VVWALLTVAVTWKLPGVSFMFVWPLVGGTLAARAIMRDHLVQAPPNVWRRRRGCAVGRDLSVAAAIIVPILYGVGAVMLGAVGARRHRGRRARVAARVASSRHKWKRSAPDGDG
jgi:hypothetical protein